MKATELPTNSVVTVRANRLIGSGDQTWTKRWTTPGGEWQSSSGELAANRYIDTLISLGAEVQGRRPLVSSETIAEAAAMEERDRLAGGPPWEVPDHPDHDLPGGWHRGQIR